MNTPKALSKVFFAVSLMLFCGASYAAQMQGCFRDSGDDFGVNGHDLNGSRFADPAMTVAMCVQKCGEQGFQFAGLQLSNQCFCGNNFGSQGRIGDDQCNEVCAGNPGEQCGGYQANRVFAAAAPAQQVASSPPATNAPVQQQPANPAAAEPGQGQSVAANLLGLLVQGGVQAYADKKAREEKEYELELERERLRMQNPNANNQQYQSNQQYQEPQTYQPSVNKDQYASTTPSSSSGAYSSNTQTNQPAAVTNGYTVNFVDYGQGQFVNRGNGWVETSNGQDRFFFQERNRDEWSVYLHDTSRNVNIQLDLHRKEIFYSDANNPRSLLYRVVRATP